MSSEGLLALDLEVGALVEHLELDGVRVVDPVSGREGSADLTVDHGVVTELRWRDERARPAGGIIVAPGFIDLHAHLREPGNEDAETFATGLAAAAHGGFTTVCVMPDTEPPIDEASTLRAVLARAAEAGQRTPIRVMAWGAASRRREGKGLAELGELAMAGAVGFTDDGAPIPGGLLRNVLAYAGMVGRPVADHAQDRELAAGAEASEGLVATVLGLKGWPRAAEESVVARDIAVLADVIAADPGEARLHLTHVSTAGSVELVRRAKAAGLPVTCDVTPYHLALTDEWLAGGRRWSWQGDDDVWAAGAISGPPYDPNLRVDPPLRSATDARALLAGLADGTVDAIATDHAPHTTVDKEVEFGLAANGISGIETALGVLLEAVAAGSLGLLRVVEALTVGPARVLRGAAGGGWETAAPALEVGRAADLVVVDLDDGWLVSESSLRSLGKNSPLLGRRLPGRVLATIAAGRLAYVDPELG